MARCSSALLPTVRAVDFLAGKDPYGLRYIAYYLEQGRDSSGSE